jgi:hypothetical protein
MKLAAIYVTWNDWELLALSVANIRPVVDGVIVVASKTSNFGLYDDSYEECAAIYGGELHQWEPRLVSYDVHQNETAKRNFGIDQAKNQGYTHLIMMDSDEFYDREDFIIVKQQVEDLGLNGVVHPLKVLFRHPTLWCNDHTLVPGIQRLTPDLKLGAYKDYPFAYDAQGGANIDPTRRSNIKRGIHMSNIPMYHASWIRKDFSVKIENSAARNNLKKSSIYKDLANAAPGYHCDFYRDTLKECENQFNLPTWDLKM